MGTIRLAARPSHAARALLLAFMVVLPAAAAAVPVGYVSHADGFVLGGKVSVLDSRRPTLFRRVLADVSFPAGVEPWWMAASPDGSKLYITDRRQDIGYNPGDVLVVDTATNTVTATIAVGLFAGELAVHPAGTFVYVTNAGDDTVSVIDAGTNTVVSTVPVPDAPGGLAVDPTGARLYVGSSGDPLATSSPMGAFTVIDTATNTMVDSVTLPYMGGATLGLHPDGTRAYLLGAAVKVIDTTTLAVLASVPVHDGNAIAVHPGGRQVYVASFCAAGDWTCNLPASVSILDTATNTIKAEIQVGVRPQGIGVSPDGKFVYVTHGLSEFVSVFRAGCRRARVRNIDLADTSVWVAFKPCPSCVVRSRPCR